MTCTRVRSQLSSYLDGDLGSTVSRALGGHLEGCPACTRHLASLRAAIEMLADLPTLSPSEGIAARVFDRLEVAQVDGLIVGGCGRLSPRGVALRRAWRSGI